MNSFPQERIITLPQSMTAENTFLLSRELDDHIRDDRIVIDMGPRKHFSPFAMIFLGSKINSIKTIRPSVKINLLNYQNHDYLKHMGFFHMCGGDYGRQMGEAQGSANYIPITRVVRDELYEEPTDKYQELPDLIQRHVDRLAKVISRDNARHKEIEEVVSYSFREIFRNVFEHSEATELHYCAQYWPTSGKLEVAVSDLGIGIRKGLSTNPNFRFKTDKEAVEASLLPGVSGRTHLPRTSENWFNSGYGLYMTSRLARHGGNFAIASGSKAIILTAKTKSNCDVSFPGTALRANFDVGKIGSVSARLGEFRDDAKAIQKLIKGAGNRPPSAMSLLLRRDFKA